MKNLKKENIHKSLFQQEMEIEQEEKNKYPATKGQITDKNFDDFFELDYTSAGGTKRSKTPLNHDKKKSKINYNIISFIDNKDTPDLYTPLGKISGNNYSLQNESDSNIKENNNKSEEKTISKEHLRYYDLDFGINLNKSDIEVSFFSLQKNKSNKNKNFCYICLSTDHYNKSECPINKRCNNCLKYGHWADNCKEIIKNKCQNCHCSVHNKEDCLKLNRAITSNELLLYKNKGIGCEFCKNENHLICPFSKREKYILNYEKKNKEQDFTNTLFCPICAGNHLKAKCPQNIHYKNKNKSNNKK